MAPVTFATPFICYGMRLVIKNTFIHVELEPSGAKRRVTSAPPRLRNETPCLLPSPCVRKAPRKRKEVASPMDDDVALRQYTAHAREERWALWASRILARRRENAWRWQGIGRRLACTKPAAQKRASVSGRMLLHLMQYAIRPLDMVVFYATRVLRRHGQEVQIWASDPLLHARKIQRLLRQVEHFSTMVISGQIMFHLPDTSMFIVRWEYDFPLSALRGKAFLECGVPPERQLLRCLGRDLHGDSLGVSGVRPGDIVDVLQKC